GPGRELSDEMGARGIDSIVFQAAITPGEHQGLIRMMVARPERIGAKGAGQFLLDEGVASVTVNASGRTIRPDEPAEPRSMGESGLVDFLLGQVRSSGALHGGWFEAPAGPRIDPGSDTETMPTVASVLQRDPVALCRAI